MAGLHDDTRDEIGSLCVARGLRARRGVLAPTLQRGFAEAGLGFRLLRQAVRLTVAERAGVSVGSVYQYFPNKDSLITALHERHAAQMYTAIDTVLAASQPRNLRGHVQAMLHALLAAHRVEPELHRALEKEFPFFDAPRDQRPADDGIYRRVRQLLEEHRDEIAPRNRDLATWVVLQTMESLVHAAVIEAPPQFPAASVECAILDLLMGYLAGTARQVSCGMDRAAASNRWNVNETF